MVFDEQTVYILMEGEPSSPEIKFLETVIGQLMIRQQLPYVAVDVLAVGGSNAFNSMAKLIYRESDLHKKIPVLAITDRDFIMQRDLEQKKGITDRQLVTDGKVRELYWGRHEWENFLLEETQLIAEICNKIPVFKSGTGIRPKISKRNSITLTGQQLDTWLFEYFQANLMDEFLECLKYHFYTASICPQLENPRDEDKLDITKIRNWFQNPINANCTPEKCRDNLAIINSRFENVLAELEWESWVNEPAAIDLGKAKIYFRGKEAFAELFRRLDTEIDLIPKLKYTQFIKDIFLGELEKHLDCLLIQEIRSMLFPYFEII